MNKKKAVKVLERPVAGYYRTLLHLLPIKFHGLRMAKTNQPMVGVVSLPAADQQEAAKGFAGLADKFGPVYADDLRSGRAVMIRVIPTIGGNRYYAPGELFFTT